MQMANTHQLISEAEYLQGELLSEVRHELVDGVAYAMAGASRNHEHIVQNLARLYGNHLFDSPCAPLGSNTLLKTPTGSMRYPDYMVSCEKEDTNEQYIEQPTLIVEVISNSTRKTDQQTKRLEYINIPTLEEYILIEQDFVNVIVYRKRDQWRPTHYFLGESVTFESIELTVEVEALYHRVENEELTQWLQDKAVS